jgi:uncharacterized DUF497 family protein
MRAMQFEWEPGKAAGNRRKHRVSFHEAASVFGDSLGVTVPEPDHSVGESRFITLRVVPNAEIFANCSRAECAASTPSSTTPARISSWGRSPIKGKAADIPSGFLS